MSNQQYLSGYTPAELEDVAQISFRSGNYITLAYIDKINPVIFKESSSFFQKYNPIFDVCYKGNHQTLDFLRNKNKTAVLAKDAKGNNCLHYAAKGGNIDIIEYFQSKKLLDFNAQNNDKETPLHYGLKYGAFKYIKTSLVLSKLTDMKLQDAEGNEPHRVQLKNIKATFRLAEYLSQTYQKQILKNS